MRYLFRLFIVMSLFIVAFIAHTPARAANVTVTDCTSFSGAGTLEDAMLTVNTGAGGTISIICTGTINFPNSFYIETDVIINNDSGGTVIFDGGNNTQFFIVSSTGSLTLNGLNLQNGNAFIGLRLGGAIYATGDLTITNSTLSGNSADDSGGAIVSGSNLTITNSTLSGNSADSGGAIFTSGLNAVSIISNSTLSGNSARRGNNGGAILSGSNMTISNSTLSGNSAGFGGAILNDARGRLTINDSILSGNSVNEDGGAIYNRGDTVTVNNSTLADNSAGITGGAIFNYLSTMTINSSTLAGNSAVASGGVIYNREATMTIRNSTLVGNTANTSGGAIDVLNGTATIINNTFLNNSAPNAGTIRMQVTGTITNNIISGVVGQCVGGVIDNTNLSNVVCGSATVFVNLGLGAFDGRVVPLLATSPALNRLPAPCADTTDQLGNRRPFGIGCDVGAVEFANPTFTEQQFLIAMQTQATIQNSAVYPLVLDIVPNGMEIAVRDNAGQIGTASLNFTHQSGMLQISIIQTTGIFGDVITAQLPQLLMLTLDDLLREAGIMDIRIHTMTINPASITFEMGAP